MKKVIVVFILLIVVLNLQAQKYTASSKDYENKFEIEFGKKEKVMRSWYHYVVTKKGKSYILRIFHPDRKLMTELITFSNKELTIRNGKYRQYNETNNGVTIGQYKNGQRFGQWTIIGSGKKGHDSLVGAYNQEGQEVGSWKTFDTKNRLQKLVTYDKGKEIETVRYDSLGKIEEPYVEKPGSKPAFVEQMPQFPNGDKALGSFLGENIRYPRKARVLYIEGRAIVNFVISEKGLVEDIYIERGVCKEIEEECIRIVRKMPTWKPGIQNGKKVKVSYTLPLNFTL